MPSFPPPNSSASPLASANHILERTRSQWLFSPSELLRAPSILDGMPAAQESSNRSKGVNFITQVGILLKLPQLTLATASVYLHRFFMRHSMVDVQGRPGLHHYAVAATALFLATKVEENCRKMKELVVACCRVAQKQPNLIVDEQSKEYWKWRDTILHNEDLLLESLCFDLQVEQPYRILFEFLNYYGVQENKRLRNASWAFLNDSHVTSICLLFPARTVAGCALYGGATQSGVAFPDDQQGRPWWQHLGLEVLDIRDAWNTKHEDMTPFDTTRLAPSPRNGFSPAGSAGGDSQNIKRDRDDDEGVHYGNGGPGLGFSDEPLTAQPAAPRANDEDVAPSPKRQRRESSLGGTISQSSSHTALPPVGQNGGQSRSSSHVDDVQQRIDDIINNAPAPPPIPNPHPHPPLSRRPSQQQQPWPGPPPRRRSSSISNRQRPPSSQGGYADLAERRSSPRRRPSCDRGFDDRSGNPDHARRRSQEFRREERPDSRENHQPISNGAAQPGEDDKADNGSEEGEL